MKPLGTLIVVIAEYFTQLLSWRMYDKPGRSKKVYKINQTLLPTKYHCYYSGLVISNIIMTG